MYSKPLFVLLCLWLRLWYGPWVRNKIILQILNIIYYSTTAMSLCSGEKCKDYGNSCHSDAVLCSLCNCWSDIDCHQLWEPGYDIFVLRFRPKTSSYQLPYQHPSSCADCAWELFKGSNESDSLLVCTRKKIFSWGLRIFCECCHKWSSFRAILTHVAWPRAKPLGQSVSLKFSLETRLKSESFEPLVDFQAFLVEKLWSKINKLINYLIK